MAYEQKDNTIIIFSNNKKTKENSPDYTGKGLVNGIEYKVAAWKKESENCAEFITVRLTEKSQYEEKYKKENTPKKINSDNIYNDETKF